MSTAMQTRERPILFSGEMVRAILDGRKTQTRRVVKTCAASDASVHYVPGAQTSFYAGDDLLDDVWCPYGQSGDRLWVREAWAPLSPINVPQPTKHDWTGCIYAATQHDASGPWRPSIHMPRRFSRLTLEITDVRVERVQEISEEDARAEGIQARGYMNNFSGVSERPWNHKRDAFRELWDAINGPRGYGWDANPWVWAITFRKVTP